MNEEETAPRPKPRVVDKRVSARPEAPPAGPDEVPAEPETEPGGPASDARAPHEDLLSSPGTATESPPASADAVAAGAPPDERDSQVWTPEQDEEMRRVAQQIAETSSYEWVVNTAITLANVAGTKLDLGAAADAQLAIDALAALVNGLGDRLGDAEAPLRQTLAQLQIAYAQAVAPPPSEP